MGYKIWIMTILIVGTFAPSLPKPTEGSALGRSPLLLPGKPAKSVPYMVALTTGLQVRAFVCGGSLVTTRTILTAAHCIEFLTDKGVLSRSLLATVGTKIWNVSGDHYEIAKSIVHANFSLVNNNDIGLLITAVEVTLSKRVQTVSLNYDFIGPNVVTKVTGWGYTDLQTRNIPSRLQQLTAKTVDGERCVTEMAKMSSKHKMIVSPVYPEYELCTFHSLNHGLCNGDSGSPLVLADSGLQIGIVSWGLPCAIGAPDVSVRISAYKDWLQQNIID